MTNCSNKFCLTLQQLPLEMSDWLPNSFHCTPIMTLCSIIPYATTDLVSITFSICPVHIQYALRQ